MERVKFKSEGFVLGNYWGGGTGGYATSKFFADTEESLIKLNKIALEDGSLDSGMGYKSLIGAILMITKTTVIKIDGRDFTNEESDILLIGDLTEEQEDFLNECLCY